MKHRNYLLFNIIILIVVTYTMSWAAEPDAAKKSVEDKQKLDAVKKMFESPYAEEDYYRADRLLVTATGSQVPVHKAPSVASVITAGEIEAMGATTLDEVLQTVPGLNVFPSGTSIFNSIWSIRGIQARINPQALLMINGIALTQSYDGGRPYLFKMPVAMISRVEVVRGPGSAVHGADAFSGVVNVITKDNFEIDGTQVGARYGSFETFDAWLQHGGQYKGWDIWGGIEHQKSEGDHDRIIDQDYMDALGLSAFSNTPGYLDTEYLITTTHLGLRKDHITFQFFGSWRKSAMGPGGLQAVTYGNEVDATELMADLSWRDKDFTSDLDLGLRLYYVYIKADNYFQLVPPSFRSMIGNPIPTDNQGGLEATAFYTGINRHQLRLSAGLKTYDTNTEHYKNFGVGITDQFGPVVDVSDTPYTFMEDQNRYIWFGSVQDEWTIISRLTFTGGVRLDQYSDFGTTINPRVALVWEPYYYLTTKLLYGRAFRAPSFAEQYVRNNPVIQGNPEVDPETIDTYELAFDLQPTNNFHTVVNFFYYKAKDLIEYVGAIGTIPTAQNTGEQEGYGFEIEVVWDVSDTFKLRTNFAHQRSENKETDSQVPDAPEFLFYLNPHWAFSRDWSLDGQYLWVGHQHRAKGDPRDDIDDYGVVNLTLRRKNIAGYLDAAVAVRNLFDEDGRTPSPYDPNAPEGAYIPNDYPIEGRSFWAELRCRF